MSTRPWTPGPWEAKKSLGKTGVSTSDDEWRISDLGIGVWGSAPEEANANARLIAAAPELYEALENLVIQTRCDSEWEHRAYCAVLKNKPCDCGLAQARHALNKANPQTSEGAEQPSGSKTEKENHDS